MQKKIKIKEIVQHSIALISADAQKSGINIAVAPAADLPSLEADSDKIKQVLLNIFLNALAAMKAGGKLSVNLSADTGHIDIIITDTGIGIERMDLPRIYDPYFTSKPAGTGLGLAVVQKIMEAHGGIIKVESALGKGTTVILRFPFSQLNKSKRDK